MQPMPLPLFLFCILLIPHSQAVPVQTDGTISRRNLQKPYPRSSLFNGEQQIYFARDEVSRTASENFNTMRRVSMKDRRRSLEDHWNKTRVTRESPFVYHDSDRPESKNVRSSQSNFADAPARLMKRSQPRGGDVGSPDSNRLDNGVTDIQDTSGHPSSHHKKAKGDRGKLEQGRDGPPTNESDDLNATSARGNDNLNPSFDKGRANKAGTEDQESPNMPSAYESTPQGVGSASSASAQGGTREAALPPMGPSSSTGSVPSSAAVPGPNDAAPLSPKSGGLGASETGLPPSPPLLPSSTSIPSTPPAAAALSSIPPNVSPSSPGFLFLPVSGPTPAKDSTSQQPLTPPSIAPSAPVPSRQTLFFNIEAPTGGQLSRFDVPSPVPASAPAPIPPPVAQPEPEKDSEAGDKKKDCKKNKSKDDSNDSIDAGQMGSLGTDSLGSDSQRQSNAPLGATGVSDSPSLSDSSLPNVGPIEGGSLSTDSSGSKPVGAFDDTSDKTRVVFRPLAGANGQQQSAPGEEMDGVSNNQSAGNAQTRPEPQPRPREFEYPYRDTRLPATGAVPSGADEKVPVVGNDLKAAPKPRAFDDDNDETFIPLRKSLADKYFIFPVNDDDRTINLKKGDMIAYVNKGPQKELRALQLLATKAAADDRLDASELNTVGAVPDREMLSGAGKRILSEQPLSQRHHPRMWPDVIWRRHASEASKRSLYSTNRKSVQDNDRGRNGRKKTKRRRSCEVRPSICLRRCNSITLTVA